MSLPVVQPGEILAFLDTGAYQDAAASTFNAMGRPATVLVGGDGAGRIIKRRETLDEAPRDLQHRPQIALAPGLSARALKARFERRRP